MQLHCCYIFSVYLLAHNGVLARAHRQTQRHIHTHTYTSKLFRSVVVVAVVLVVDVLDVSIQQSFSFLTCSCIVWLCAYAEADEHIRPFWCLKKKEEKAARDTHVMFVRFLLLLLLYPSLPAWLPRSHFSLGRCSLFIHSASLCISSARARNEHSHSIHFLLDVFTFSWLERTSMLKMKTTVVSID